MGSDGNGQCPKLNQYTYTSPRGQRHIVKIPSCHWNFRITFTE